MKIAILFGLFTCLMLVEASRAENLDVQSAQQIRREICRLEAVNNHVAASLEKAFFKRCTTELKIAGWLGEFYYDARFYPEGFASALNVGALPVNGAIREK